MIPVQRELDEAERTAVVVAATLSLFHASPAEALERADDPTVWRFSARWWNHSGSRARQRPETRRGW